jgi:hypothetical protein
VVSSLPTLRAWLAAVATSGTTAIAVQTRETREKLRVWEPSPKMGNGSPRRARRMKIPTTFR